MALSKNRVVIITILLAIAYFFAFFLLPDNIIGERRDDIVLYASKVLFLAITAAFVTSFVLTFIFRRNYYTGQLAAFMKYRHYLRLLVKRDFVAKYRKSVLGVVWSVLNPLLTMLVLYMVFSYLFGSLGSIEPNFAIYLISGQIIFNFFSESTNMSMRSVIEGEGVIKKVYVPKYVFPLSKMLSSLVNLAFSFIAFLIVFLFTRVDFHWTMLLIPIPLFYVFIFALGVGMLMSSLAVFFRDLTYLYGVLITLWMYLTPIFYPAEIIPEALRSYYGLNPMYQFVTYFRSVAIWQQVPDLWSNITCIALALSSLCIGTYVFMRRQNRYILYL